MSKSDTASEKIVFAIVMYICIILFVCVIPIALIWNLNHHQEPNNILESICTYTDIRSYQQTETNDTYLVIIEFTYMTDNGFVVGHFSLQEKGNITIILEKLRTEYPFGESVTCYYMQNNNTEVYITNDPNDLSPHDNNSKIAVYFTIALLICGCIITIIYCSMMFICVPQWLQGLSPTDRIMESCNPRYEKLNNGDNNNHDLNTESTIYDSQL